MSEYLLLFREKDSYVSNQTPEQTKKINQKWKNWFDDLGKQGKLLGGQPLAKVGRVIKGSTKNVTEGPFTEAKEVVDGYATVRARDLNEAVEISKNCPVLENDGIVEVREMEQMPVTANY